MHLTELQLRDWSKIDVRFYTDDASDLTCLTILVIKYVGVYRWGSEGYPDAVYMRAMAKAGLDAFNPWCVIYDLSELSYAWGNNINEVFPNVDIKPPSVPIAVVLGPNCEPGMPHLYSLLATDEYVDRGEFVYFRRLDFAWKYVSARFADSEKKL